MRGISIIKCGLRNNAFQFSMARQYQWALGPLILEVSRSQSVDTSQSEVPLDEFTARRRDLCLTTHKTDFHAAGRIRNHNPNKQAAADPRHRRCGHWDRRCIFYIRILLLLLFNACGYTGNLHLCYRAS